MIYGVALSVLGVGFGSLSWQLRSNVFLSGWFGWCALVVLFVAMGYFGRIPAVFGKSPTGHRALWATVLLFPYFAGVALARWLQRTLTGEDGCNQVAPGLYVGRLVPTADLPSDIALVVDLTAELLEPKLTRERFEYRCLPTLDGTAPPVDTLRAFVDGVVAHAGPTYIHCAAGHGRAAMLTSIVLVRRGHADDIASAERLMQQHRPRVRMTREQRSHASKAV